MCSFRAALVQAGARCVEFDRVTSSSSHDRHWELSAEHLPAGLHLATLPGPGSGRPTLLLTPPLTALPRARRFGCPDQAVCPG